MLRGWTLGRECQANDPQGRFLDLCLYLRSLHPSEAVI